MMVDAVGNVGMAPRAVGERRAGVGRLEEGEERVLGRVGECGGLLCFRRCW